MKKSLNGKLIDLTAEEEARWEQQCVEGKARAVELAKVQYQKDRMLQFPSIGDQLDMQYHDELNGTTTWKDAVAKVKSDNPKG